MCSTCIACSSGRKHRPRRDSVQWTVEPGVRGIVLAAFARQETDFANSDRAWWATSCCTLICISRHRRPRLVAYLHVPLLRAFASLSGCLATADPMSRCMATMADYTQSWIPGPKHMQCPRNRSIELLNIKQIIVQPSESEPSRRHRA